MRNKYNQNNFQRFWKMILQHKKIIRRMNLMIIYWIWFDRLIGWLIQYLLTSRSNVLYSYEDVRVICNWPQNISMSKRNYWEKNSCMFLNKDTDFFRDDKVDKF